MNLMTNMSHLISKIAPLKKHPTAQGTIKKKEFLPIKTSRLHQSLSVQKKQFFAIWTYRTIEGIWEDFITR